ncbi:hypothetical protein JTE90_007561 [Oedothorax gibbosus]|uniref:Aminoglycoside phosphotransferase domain-containing protein n=1 Tax=Oedothorax gibbosus TaxID=931172 RepID=A0AAV6TPX2_9ARAC|nr:hypothetical protein JTE90_007561 [Oedothorax gibbosus]
MKECINIVQKTKAFRDIGARMFQTKFPGCKEHPIYSESYARCVVFFRKNLPHDSANAFIHGDISNGYLGILSQQVIVADLGL